MFLVFNKDKIYAYGISIITVILLFCAASTMLTDNPETILTGSTAGKQLPIYKVDTQEKKVALTINCAWNDSDIDNILQTLNNNNCKVTFFMVGDWVKKYPEAAKNRNTFKHTPTCKQSRLRKKRKRTKRKCKNNKRNHRSRSKTI